MLAALRVLVVDDNATNRRILGGDAQQLGNAADCGRQRIGRSAEMEHAAETSQPIVLALVDAVDAGNGRFRTGRPDQASAPPG